MAIKNKSRILLIVQDRRERRMLNVIKNNMKMKIQIILGRNMKLLNWRWRMMIAHHFQLATGLFNSVHTAEKRSWSEMCQVVSTPCRRPTTSIGLGSHQLLRIQPMEKGCTRSKESPTPILATIKIIAVKTIEWREASAKILTTEIKIRKEETVKWESHFKAPRRISLQRAISTTELIDQMLVRLFHKKCRTKVLLSFKEIQILR